MRTTTCVLILVLLSVFSPAAAALTGLARHQSESPWECRDGRNRTGTCSQILECPGLSWMVENGRRPTSIELHFLKRSVCGVRNSRLFVCCALTSSPNATRSPDDHPNRRLVEEGTFCGTYVHHRVRGGTEVPLGRYPWMAVLFYRHLFTGAVEAGCGGALISKQHVLTAAHCVTGLSDVVLTSVRLGEHNLASSRDCQNLADLSIICNNPQNFQIEKVFWHEEYNIPHPRFNDIALLKLDRPVVEDEFVGRICLPFGIAALRDYTGVNMTAAGFGKLGPNRLSPSSNVLMEVTLPGVQQQHCRVVIERNGGHIGEKQICAGAERGRDSCAGDSGGPLIAATPNGPPYTLVGTISFGSVRCGEGGIPSVNARVSEYMNWILDRLD